MFCRANVVYVALTNAEKMAGPVLVVQMLLMLLKTANSQVPVQSPGHASIELVCAILCTKLILDCGRTAKPFVVCTAELSVKSAERLLGAAVVGP